MEIGSIWLIKGVHVVEELDERFYSLPCAQDISLGLELGHEVMMWNEYASYHCSVNQRIENGEGKGRRNGTALGVYRTARSEHGRDP